MPGVNHMHFPSLLVFHVDVLLRGELSEQLVNALFLSSSFAKGALSYSSIYLHQISFVRILFRMALRWALVCVVLVCVVD